ncbi:MAG: HD domain-containing protein [Lachnospiraceae bacterium]|nr:HD domain-containing protein [Lachnospiraceae bacterium]
MLIEKAAAFAERAHRGAVRKGTDIPYITHPLETAVIVASITSDEEVIAAALLHDVVEDAGVTEERLSEQFGERIARLVAAESEDKSKSWTERKAAAIEHLKAASREEKIITLGDKLSNIRSTARDYLLLGEAIWDRFNEKRKERHAWYYEGMAEGLSELSSYPEYQEYVRLCRMVFHSEGIFPK